LALSPNWSQNTYTEAARKPAGGCDTPQTHTSYENFSTTGGQALVDRYTTASEGALITGWSVTSGSDIPATKDLSFSKSMSDTGVAQVTVKMVLFHKPN